MEFKARELLRKQLKRGKVDVTLKLEPEASGQALALNTELLEQIVAAANQVKAAAPEATPPTTLDLLRWPGVLESSRADQDSIMQAATDVFAQALERLREARASEGQRLEMLLQQQLTTIDELVESVRPFADNVMHTTATSATTASVQLPIQPGKKWRCWPNAAMFAKNWIDWLFTQPKRAS